MRSAKVALTILFLFSIFIPPELVHADMAPPPAPGIGGLAPFEYQDTEVQMVFERVELELKSISNPFDPTIQTNQIDVTAWFVMHNQGQTDESMQAVFPLSDFNSCRYEHVVGGVPAFSLYEIMPETFEVSVNGTQVATTTVETDHPHASDTESCQGDKMNWGAFNVTFPVDQDVLVRVNYSMQETFGGDSVQGLEYVLETGAGWKGPIKEGYVIVKFPYTVENEAILTGTTPGFQKQQNEIFWSIDNLEPKESDNIAVVIVSPKSWLGMQASRETIKKNPSSSDAWLSLISEYERISSEGKGNIRSREYDAKIVPAYEEAIALNPSSADLPANYAQSLFGNCCFYTPENFPASKSKILALLNKALALDPKNETALDLIGTIQDLVNGFEFTPPATIPPTATFLFSPTPSITSTSTVRPISSEQQVPNATPIVVTVVSIKIVKVPAPTLTPWPTPTISATDVPQNGGQNKSGSAFVVFGALLTFIAGLGVGIFWSRRPRV
jgi:Cytochrome c biogenesis factor